MKFSEPVLKTCFSVHLNWFVQQQSHDALYSCGKKIDQVQWLKHARMKIYGIHDRTKFPWWDLVILCAITNLSKSNNASHINSYLIMKVLYKSNC